MDEKHYYRRLLDNYYHGVNYQPALGVEPTAYKPKIIEDVILRHPATISYVGARSTSHGEYSHGSVPVTCRRVHTLPDTNIQTTFKFRIAYNATSQSFSFGNIDSSLLVVQKSLSSRDNYHRTTPVQLDI